MLRLLALVVVSLGMLFVAACTDEDGGTDGGPVGADEMAQRLDAANAQFEGIASTTTCESIGNEAAEVYRCRTERPGYDPPLVDDCYVPFEESSVGILVAPCPSGSP